MTADVWRLLLADGQTGHPINFDELYASIGNTDHVVRGAGLAALLLYAQPGGFSREDVAVLNYVRSNWSASLKHEDYDRLRSLADRIEALLPPEGT